MVLIERPTGVRVCGRRSCTCTKMDLRGASLQRSLESKRVEHVKGSFEGVGLGLFPKVDQNWASVMSDLENSSQYNARSIGF